MQRCPRCQQDLPLDSYPPSSRGRPGTYCRGCKVAIYRERRPALPQMCCEACGKSFAPRTSDQRFCSLDCKTRTRYRPRQGSRPAARPPLSRAGEIHQATCVRCGDAFVYEFKRRTRNRCDSCRLRGGGGKPSDRGMTARASMEMRRDATSCGICGATKAAGTAGKGWHVDHCHSTGKIRGVLCARCNMALGLLDDDPARLEAAAAYIRRHAAS